MPRGHQDIRGYAVGEKFEAFGVPRTKRVKYTESRWLDQPREGFTDRMGALTRVQTSDESMPGVTVQQAVKWNGLSGG